MSRSDDSSTRPPEPTFISGLYEGTAADYDRFRLQYPDRLIDFVRAAFPANGAGQLVDLGAGPGHVARALRPFVKRVVAVDPEADMVEYGRMRTEQEHDGIEWRLTRAEDAEFPSGSVDVVTAGNAFHRFDRPVVVAKARRWLSTGGVIVVLWGDTLLRQDELWQVELSRVVDEWMERSGAGARIPAGWQRDEYPDEVVLQEAGFDRQVLHDVTVRHAWTVETVLGFLHATSFGSRAALQDHFDAFDRAVRDALLAVDPTGTFAQDVKFGARIARQ